MINLEKLDNVLIDFKMDFINDHWETEKYKWKAVKQFQDHWDINAPNFIEMFSLATEKTANLLGSQNNFPKGMIREFSKKEPETVRAMFINLFDESKDLEDRVDKFQNDSETIRKKYDDGTWTNHFQNLNSISTYLWLRFPDKYYIYKYSEYKVVAKILESETVIKTGFSTTTLMGGFKLYDEICDYLLKDKDLKQLIQSVITTDCYSDPALKTLTIDVGFYISRKYSKTIEELTEDWFPANYTPSISFDEWGILLRNTTIFDANSLAIMKRFKDHGGMATCTELSLKYGESRNFYNVGSSSLAKRVAEITKCPVPTEQTENSKWWPILYVGKKVVSESSGSYVWKLREELSNALDHMDLSNIPLYVKELRKVWKISHGTDFFTKTELQHYESKKLVLVHRDTKPIALSTESQGYNYINTIKKGDFFYLCYSNQIKLLGQFTSEIASVNNDKDEGWYQREYTIVKESKDTSPYANTKKWWTPNYNSTCVQVPEIELDIFETLILKPYFDLTKNELFGKEKQDTMYWWLNANPKIWSFSNMAIGATENYTLYNDNGNKRHIFQNFLDVKPGDLVIGYESNPVKQVVAIAKITKANDGQNIYFEKIENLSVPIDYSTLLKCPELAEMEYFASPQGSLFKLTKSEFDFIMDIIREVNPNTGSEKLEPYSKDQFLSEVFITNERYETLVALLKTKKNLILQGAPGVGKTFAAKRLAFSIMNQVDESRVEFVQFHQNYSYEDFIMGYKPNESGFELQTGLFYRFCQKASNSPDKSFFFIIDEINRGNLSKIFGELLLLIENDYRGTKATLAYNGLPFSVPKNLYLIGMMNTADRSLAMIDYALRRRFSFFEMEPGFTSKGFKDYQAKLKNDTFDKLIEKIRSLNNDITSDSSLGKGFCIGHSYFCNQEKCTEQWMRNVVEYEIIPMLREYWFDEPTKLLGWENSLRGIFNDQ